MALSRNEIRDAIVRGIGHDYEDVRVIEAMTDEVMSVIDNFFSETILRSVYGGKDGLSTLRAAARAVCINGSRGDL